MKRILLFILSLLLFFVQSCEQEKGEPLYLIVNSSDVISFDAEKGTASFTIQSNGIWQVVENPEWLNLDKNTGKGDATITISCDENTYSDITREGVIVISLKEDPSQKITKRIRQSAATPRITVVKNSVSFDVDGGITTIGIKSNAKEPSWSATSEVDWLSFAIINGSESDSLRIEATPNLAKARRANVKLSIKGADVFIGVSQTAVSFDLDVSSLYSNVNGETFIIHLSSSSKKVKWTTYSDCDWATCSATGSVEDPIIITTSANPGKERYASISVSFGDSTKGISLSQEGLSVIISPDSISFDVDGGEQDLSISSNSSSITWEVVSKPDWIEIYPASGALTESIHIVSNTNLSNLSEELIEIKTGEISTVIHVQQPFATISIEKPSATFDVEESSGTIQISSNSKKAKWRCTSLDNWISLSALEGYDGESITYTVSKNSGAFRRGEIVFEMGSSKATMMISQHTEPSRFDNPSNCFIVSKDGRYAFDASVIGNGANGIINGVGFHTSSPVIEPKSMGIVWQDQQSLITDLFLVNKEARFSVSGKGNAIIAAYSGEDRTGSILWSWHIWCTDRPKDQRYVNNDKEVFYLMDRNVGATSTSDGKSMGCFFQWGRKDPFIERGGYESTEFAQPSFISKSKGQVSIDETIKHPTVFYIPSSSNWESSGGQYNVNSYLWGNPQGGSERVKTIYDPCPEGYMVPESRVWTGFTKSGASASTWDDVNYKEYIEDGSRRGIVFYTDDSKTETSWYPFVGYVEEGWTSNGLAIYYYNYLIRLWASDVITNYGATTRQYPRVFNVYYSSYHKELGIGISHFSPAYGCVLRCVKQ